MTSCAAQCLPDASAQVLDLIAEDEHELRTVSKCSIIKKAGCAVGVAAAIGSCGGPANIPCIISRLKALHGCGKWYLLPSSPPHNHLCPSTPLRMNVTYILFPSTASARSSSAGACARTSARSRTSSSLVTCSFNQTNTSFCGLCEEVDWVYWSLYMSFMGT
jgi:hypothetical protein